MLMHCPISNKKYSPACWETEAVVRLEHAKLGSRREKMEALKDQIRMQVVECGWKDLHCAWSKDESDHPPETLMNHLINVIIPDQDQNKCGIPDKPKSIYLLVDKIDLHWVH